MKIKNWISATLCFFSPLVMAYERGCYIGDIERCDSETARVVFDDIRNTGVPVLRFYDNKEFKGMPVFELNAEGFWHGKTKCRNWKSSESSGGKPIIRLKDRQPGNWSLPWIDIAECYSDHKKKENIIEVNVFKAQGMDDHFVSIRVYRKPQNDIAEVPYIPPKGKERTLYLNLKGLPPYFVDLSIQERLGPKRIKAFYDFKKTMHNCIQKKDRACLIKNMNATVSVFHKTGTQFCAKGGKITGASAALDCIFSDKALLKEFDDCFTGKLPKYPSLLGDSSEVLPAGELACYVNDLKRDNHWAFLSMQLRENNESDE